MNTTTKVYTMEDLETYGKRLHLNTALEFIVNGIAGYIVLKHSTKAMGFYKYYIFSTIFWAFFMDFNITFIFGPYPILPTAILCSAGVVGKNLDWIWGRVVPYCLLHFNLSFAGLSIVNGFLYQYFSLMGKEEFFQSFKGIFLLYLSMFLYPLPSLICLLFTLDRQGAIEYVHDNYPFAYQLFITAPCNTFVWNALSKIYFAIVFAQIVIMCIVVWILFFTIRKKLYSLRSTLSSQTLRARRQLLLALFLQVFLPAGILVTPILIFIGGIVLKVENLRNFSVYGMQILALHSCLNAILVVVIITPYRRVLQRWFRWLTYYPRKILCKTQPTSIMSEDLFNTTSHVLTS